MAIPSVERVAFPTFREASIFVKKTYRAVRSINKVFLETISSYIE